MRTLLTDLFPPQSVNEQTFFPRAEPSQSVGNASRTFSPTAVLASVDDLLEVGVDGTAIAAPGALAAEEAAPALERGVAMTSSSFQSNNLSSSACCAGAGCKPSAENDMNS
ncbi:MAG TPA: hypothetical protein VGI88_10895 [Verrucomicrobiae bacterium]|jgi:hypothetical protein